MIGGEAALGIPAVAVFDEVCRRDGFLNGASPAQLGPRVEAFRAGLVEKGYVEAHSVAIEFRWGLGQNERLPELAADLVRQRVAVIAATGDAITIVRPETVVRWHRAGFAAYWRWKSRPLGGRPQIGKEVRDLIRRMSFREPAVGRS